MKMKNILSLILVGVMATFLLAACGGEDDSSENASGNQENATNDNDNNGNNENGSDDEKLQVVGDFTIISDIVEKVGGDRVDVYNVIPKGEEPHEWDPSPEDTKKTVDSDMFFYFGWNLEGLDSDSENWVYKMLNAAEKDKEDDDVFALSDGIEQLKLDTEEFEGTPNPHGFNTPKNGITMVENARDAYIEIDPDHEDVYKENADKFLEELEDLDRQYEEKIGDIPEEDRILVASERSMQYVAEQYGLEEGWIWERDGEHEGTPDQIKNTIKFVKDKEPKALFVEYTSDKRPMNTVSDETGIPIAGSLYSEDLGTADDFVDYLRHNLFTILDGLTQEHDD